MNFFIFSFLLQVPSSSEKSRDTIPSFPSSETACFSPYNSYSLKAYQKCPCQGTSHSHTQNLLMESSKPPIPLQHKLQDKESVQCSQEIMCAGWTDHTHSLISMATEAFHSVSTYPSTTHPCSSFSLTIPRFRINVDTLVGAKETDVDTGQAVISRSVDLSVVSAYLLPQTKMNSKVPQSLSEPPQWFSVTSSFNSSNKTALLPKSVSALQDNLKWNRSKYENNGSDLTQDCREEDKQEFFI